ncbi:hypothetical protein [Flavobacterium sp. WC2430]|uniref:hypothetical protein n=1 Tax=Flavobacterium sp. WC2430 TaxID=3234137 RepID=UPI00346639EA
MQKQAKIFWTSYADLMTSLFFIMLVLFVLAIAMMKKDAKANKEQIDMINNIQKSIEKLDKTYFSYDNDYKRFSLNKQIQFEPADSKIQDQYKPYLLAVGKEIENLIVELKSDIKNKDIKYMIIIEGMASNDYYKRNDELSYLRALSLFKLWSQNNIYFDPSICELQIAGSGIKGVGRFQGKNNEFKNQRFLIQIIPKIGKLKN